MRSLVRLVRVKTITVSLALSSLLATAAGEDFRPSQKAREAARRIRVEALLPPNGPAGRPLPLASHWNMGSQGRGWTPQYQMELLDASLDPPRPWEHATNLPVFSMALALGEEGARRWLVYAHSPLENRTGVTITLPEFGEIPVDAPRAGAFYVVSEKEGNVAKLEL